MAIASGTVDVSGKTGDNVNVLGNKVGVIGANINASGTQGGDTTFTLPADDTIIVNAGANITSQNGKLNVTINSDRDGNGAGAIAITKAIALVSL